MASTEARRTRSRQSYSSPSQSYAPTYSNRHVFVQRSGSATRAARPLREREYTTGSRVNTRVYQRPELRLSARSVEKSRADYIGNGLVISIQNVASNRRFSTIMCVTSVLCLVLSLCGTLMLRTLMVENAYTISQTQVSVSRLAQDVQQDKAKLNSLEADLPQRATQMGMRQGTTSMTIDMRNSH